MKKIILFILVCSLALSCLSACSIFGGGDNGDNGGSTDNGGNTDNGGTNDNNNTNNGGNTDDSGSTATPIYTIIAEESLSNKTVRAFANKLSEATGLIFVVGAGGFSAKNVIFIGDTNSSVSDLAYRYYEEEFGYDDSSEIANYLAFKKDDALAIAYGTYGMDPALDALVANCTEWLSAKENGVVASNSVNMIQYLDKLREEQLEENLAEAGEILSDDIIDALRDFYSLYNEGLYMWVANLFDPETGSFYYSNSARDTIGYLTDLESTRQAIDLISKTGLMADYGNSYYSFLNAEEKETLANWVRSLQNSKDGYFYHPQWGTSGSDARKGRDLDWATTILRNLGAKPYYNTPDGMAGIGAPSTASALVSPVGTSVAVAVSKAVAASSVENLPSYLQTTEAWETYINNLNWKTNSYGAGNQLAAQHTQIKAAGQEYIDILMNFLNENQKSTNGLWETQVNYASVNGLMKIASIYNYMGYKLNYLEQALASTLEVALTPDFTPGDEHVCSIYNVWVCMNFILNSAQDEEQRAQLQQIIYDNAVDLVNVSREKLSIFKVDGGSFSYFRGKSSHLSQGQLVAVPSTYEGDMNATAISCNSLRGSILLVLGLEVEDMPIFTPQDGRYFINTIRSLGEILKYPAEPVELESCNDMELGEWETDMSGNLTIQDLASNAATLTIKENSYGNKYLEYDKTSTQAGGRLGFTKTDKVDSAAVVFQANVKHNHLSTSKNCSYFRFYDQSNKQFTVGNSNAYYFSGATGSEIGNVTLGGKDLGVSEGEWFTLKFRFTADTLEVYVNGNLIESFTVEGIYNISQIRLQCDSNMVHKTEFDNIYFGAEEYLEQPDANDQLENDKLPEPDEGDDEENLEDNITNIGEPETSVKFDELENNSAWDSTTTNAVTIKPINPGEGDTVTVRTENDNKYLEYDKNSSSKGIFEFWNTSGTTSADKVVFYTKIRFNEASENFATFVFWSVKDTGAYKSAYYPTGSNTYYVSVAENGNITIGGKDTGAKVGEWFSLAYRITANKLQVFVNGDLFQTFEITGVQDSTIVRLQCEPGIIHKTDFDDVYYGLDYAVPGEGGAPAGPEVVGQPENAVDFEDMTKDTAWDPTATTDVTIKTVNQGASDTVTVCEEENNKYLEYIKATTAKGIFEFWNTSGTTANDTVIFHTNLRVNEYSNINFAAFLFYGLKADGVSYQTAYYPTGSNTYYVSVAENGNITIGGKDTGAKVGEWFSLAFKIEANSLKVFVNGNLFQTFEVTGIENAKLVRLQSVANDRTYKIDFDSVYYGADYTDGSEGDTPAGPEVVGEAKDSVAFDDLTKDTAWSTDLATDVKIQDISKNSSSTSIVREEDENKYLEYNKQGTGKGIFEIWKTAETSTAEPVIFQAKIRVNSADANGATFLFYSIVNGTYKTPYYPTGSNDYYISVSEGGNVTIGGKDTGVAKGEWFTLSFKIETNTLKVFVNGDLFQSFAVTGIENAALVRVQSSVDSKVYQIDFDNVYYGADIK